MSKEFRPGDIVEIPLPNGTIATGWIIYVSGYFKNLIGVIISGFKEIERNESTEYLSTLPPIYTSALAAMHYHWKIVGYRDVDELTFQRTRRIVGGEIFVGDNFLRPATVQDRKILHEMLAKGMPVVHEELETIASKVAQL